MGSMHKMYWVIKEIDQACGISQSTTLIDYCQVINKYESPTVMLVVTHYILFADLKFHV